jgi:hypothetical protein
MGPAGQPGEKRMERAGPVLATGLIRTGGGPSAGERKERDWAVGEGRGLLAGPSWAGVGKKGAGQALGWVWFSISFSFLFPFLFFQTNSN